MSEILEKRTIAPNAGYALCDFRDDIPRSTIFDLISFINLFEIKSVSRNYIRINFEDLKDSWITKDFKTIWQLSSDQKLKEYKVVPVGLDEIASVEFFRYLLFGLIEKNPKYKSMLENLTRPFTHCA